MKLTSTIFYLFNTHSHICCQFIIFIIKNKRGMCYCIFSKCTYFFICKSSWNPKCIRRSINKRFLFRSQHYSRFSYILKIVKLFFRKKLFITSNGIRLLPPTMDISSIKNLPGQTSTSNGSLSKISFCISTPGYTSISFKPFGVRRKTQRSVT